MISFFYNNQSLLFVIGVVIFFFIIYLLVKALPTMTEKKDGKKPKVEKIYEPKKEDPPKKEKLEKIEPEKVEPKVPEDEQKETEEKRKLKKQDKKPKIVQVFKREPATTQEGKTEKIDPIYDRNVEFVNTSKNISKFKSFKDESEGKKSEISEETKNDEFGFVTDKKDDCEYCEDHVKHFDHSKRLSKYINGDENEMFGSHLSEHYMNIDVNRRLNLDESKMYGRLNAMMDNTESRIVGTNEDRLGYARDWYNLAEENIASTNANKNLDLKTAVIAEAYMKRKKKK